MTYQVYWQKIVRVTAFNVPYFCLLLSILSVLATPSLFATPASLQNYFQESWTTREGLPHNTINSINQSRDGYLWIATWEGIARFNGRQFELFGRGPLTGLPDSGTRTLSVNANGDLLIAGSRGGAAKLTAEGWHSWQPFDVLLNAIQQDLQQNLWLGSEGQGLFLQTSAGQRQRFTVEQGLPSDIVHSLLLDAQGILWIGTGRGLVTLDTTQANIQFKRISGLPEAPVFVVRPQQQQMLIGTEQGLYRVEHGQATLFHPQLKQIPISSLWVQTDQLWIGTTDQGLFRYSSLGLEQLNIAAGLPNNRILSIFVDREQSIWVGTNGGLFRLRDAPFVTYTQDMGLAGDYVRAVLAHSDGSIWVGTSQGISRIKDKIISSINISDNGNTPSVLSLTEAVDGSVWIGTYSDGLLHWQDGRIVQRYNRLNGLAANEVRAILVAEDGSLWVGTAQGLNHISTTGISLISTDEGLPVPFVIGLYQHTDKRLFVATGGGVAVVFTDGHVEQIPLAAYEGAEYAFGFAYDAESALLWMTSDRGLLAYNPDNGQMTSIGRDAGLPVDKLFQLVIDKQQNFWISSNRGVFRIARQDVMHALHHQQLLSYDLFGEGDGMQSAQANGGSMPAAVLDQQGAVWIATSKGVSTVQPQILKRFSANIPPIIIEEMRVDGTPVMNTDTLSLTAGVSRIEFKFAGLGFIMPQRMRYRTRLQGFDSDWVTRDTQNSAEYTNLPPGDYQFSVIASYPQGDWSPVAASINFSIAPYLWQRRLFWLFVAIITVLIAVLAVRWRTSNLKRREQELSLQIGEKTLELQQQADNLKAVDRERSELLVQIKQQAERFELQARLDALTGLANRRAFDEALARECARSRRTGHSLCMVLLDIDHFKQVNDIYSHSIGDKVLQLVAKQITLYCREEDTVARWGGEEFAILLPHTGVQQTLEICERIRLAVMRIDCSDFATALHITVSCGVAEFGDDQLHDKLLSRSDTALYQAKQSGRNRVEVAL